MLGRPVRGLCPLFSVLNFETRAGNPTAIGSYPLCSHSLTTLIRLWVGISGCSCHQSGEGRGGRGCVVV